MTTTLRVLHIHAGNLYGGVETVLLAMVRLRHECPEMESSFALCFEGRLSQELNAAGAAVYQLGEVRFRYPWTAWMARRRLGRLLSTQQYDVVMFHSCWSHALFARRVKRRGIPIVHWIHGASSADHWQARMARRNPPDLVLANSRFIAEQSAELFPGVRTEVQFPFVEIKPIADRDAVRRLVREELNTPDDAVVIVTACRLERGKGQSILLEALAQLVDVPGWNCWIVGGAQRPAELAYEAELKQTAMANRVKFVGERKDVPEMLAAADIYCQPNITPEGFGLTFVEAMAAELPVVTTRFGGALDIVDSSSGILNEPNDVTSVANALRTLIADANRRRVFGDAGRDRAHQCFAPDRLMNQLHGHLASCARL